MSLILRALEPGPGAQRPCIGGKFHYTSPGPRKTLNRHDAKVAKDMMVRPFDRSTGNRAVGSFRISVPLPKWPILALAFMASWRLIFSDRG